MGLKLVQGAGLQEGLIRDARISGIYRHVLPNIGNPTP